MYIYSPNLGVEVVTTNLRLPILQCLIDGKLLDDIWKACTKHKVPIMSSWITSFIGGQPTKSC